MSNDFKNTLNLPKTDFPMRANLANREPERLKHWESFRIYQEVLKKNSEGIPFVLHDGPPYANGNIHLGHALNKVLKDIIIRYKSMRGYRAPYVPGWDCHGLPIEQQVLKKVGSKIHEMEPVDLRRLCHDYAEKFVNLQKDQFKRLGINGDWDEPYLTFNPKFEAGILSCLKDLVSNGLVKKGFRCVHWDTTFRTALAEAEIEHKAHTSDSIYVRFPLIDSEKFSELEGLSNISFVIWTTTPWTLPANLGVSLNPNLKYVAIEHDGQTSIVAEELAQSFQENCKIKEGKIVATFNVENFDRARCCHPIFGNKTSLIMLGEHVTLEQGTGCVHTAPGHGADDFNIGKKYGLPVLVPVDERGCFTSDYPDMEGVHVFSANPKIIEILEENKLLLSATKVTHEYPYSWRSHKPIIFRATEQWFFELNIGDVKNKAINAIDNDVQWIPRWGYERIHSMVENRPDWCLSRQRSWGVPIPSIRSKKSGESFLNIQIINKFIEKVKRQGSNCWYTDSLEDFWSEGIVYEPTGESHPDDFEKEFDILDVWFDSGASHIACLEQDERLSSPADLYLEGSDQHRGWFQSALLTSIGSRDRAPYKAVLTHGFVLDGKGKAMSKSAGNVISPKQLIDKLGADVVRLWVSSEDYRNDLKVSDEIIDRIAETYRLFRNTLRFQISNLFDFIYENDAIALEKLRPLDKWALHQLSELIESVTAAYDSYEFHKVYQICNKYCAVTLSALYHDMLKDRLYTFDSESSDRRSAQTVVYHSLKTLMRLMAPILVFTSDEAFSFNEENKNLINDSVHLQSWPEIPKNWLNSEIAKDVSQLLKIRSLAYEKLEVLRQNKEIGQSLEAQITISGNPNNSDFELLLKYEEMLTELFIASKVILVENSNVSETSIEFHTKHASGERCPRCWYWIDSNNGCSRSSECPMVKQECT